MRPVNLIPPEDRRGDRAPLRAGSVSYLIVGAFAAGLIAVLALVLTQNSITNKENEIAELEVARDAAAERAAALAPYAQFASLQEQREMTIASLAESRFDWERVLRELALVIPGGVNLDNLEAATVGDTGDVAATTSAVPSLKMSGCAPSHDVVAKFVAALEDIDGITRVGLESSTEADSETSGTGTTNGSSSTCAPSAKTFALTAVFDGVVTDAAVAPAPTVPPADPPAEEEGAPANSSEEQVDEAETATNVVPGTAR